ncbi:hemicentin-1-like [Babylonia areolata]|uniref:hemicentin-1-like n=1 Tax=Babylonia areolata TaxID=304850 RepID=UPI003FD39335
MASQIYLFLVLVSAGLVSVSAQDPEIVDEIWPEVQQVGRTGRLNCTVANKDTHVVMWHHVDTGEHISNDDKIEYQNNPMIGGLRKYEVRKRLSGDRTTYMLVIRRLVETDAGTYKCTIRITAVAFDQWPTKLGTLTVQVPPTIRPGETTAVMQIDQGQNSSLVCSASGIPYPNITWTKSDGGFLPVGVAQYRSRTLPMINVTVKDMGVYRCVADNNIKPPAEHLAQVLVFHAPTTRVVQNSVGQAQNRRFHAKLECIVKGHPEPTVTWQRLINNGRVPITDDDKFDINKQTTDNQNLKAGEQWYTLKVKNVQANDFTDYYCIASNKKGYDESIITLFETMECQGPNCPSLPSSRALRQQWSALVFVPAAALILVGALRGRQNSTMFAVAGVACLLLVVPLTRAQDPEIVDDILPEVQKVGGTARLNCTVANKQTNNVFWIHEDTHELISIDQTIVMQINPKVGGLRKYEVLLKGPEDRLTYTLLIRRLRQQDAGRYVCQVKIQNENVQSQVQKTGTLTVQVPPKIRPGDTTTLIEVDQNQNASLVCSSMGIPYPNITWTRLDGMSLPTGHAQYRGHVLPLTAASVEHMGVYRCVADNNIKPPDEHLCEVRVFHAPTARTVQNSVGQAQNRRFTARLDCIVNGYPRPKVHWEKVVSGGRVVLTDNDFYVNTKQTTDNQNMMSGEQWYTLKIKNVRANDYTDYHCIANNKKGTATIMVSVFETPDCQGPNCPSLGTGETSGIRFSPLLLLLMLAGLKLLQ